MESTIRPSLDCERCIELHNAIVEAGLNRLPPSRRENISTRCNWFSIHSLTPAEARLPDELAIFLSRIEIVEPASQLSFLPHLRGISSPAELRQETDDRFHGGRINCVILYKSHGPNGLGLVLDLNDYLCCFVDDTRDSLNAQRLWVPLHDALERYLRCIQYGKFVIRSEAFTDDLSESQGWRFEPWTNADLERTLQIWKDLVQAITERLPVSPVQSSVPGFVDRETLDRFPAIPSFVREFLLRAVKPSFEFIAPQLRVPDADFISSIGLQLQGRLGASDGHRDASVGFLLFPWARRGVDFSDTREQQLWHRVILDNRAGLYLISTPLFADAATLLLPYPIGGNGWLLAGDGARVSGRGNAKLYNHGHCPFIPGHQTQLSAILVQWWEKLENGEWTVGLRGVENDEDIWQEADTEEGAEAYKVAFVCI